MTDTTTTTTEATETGTEGSAAQTTAPKTSPADKAGEGKHGTTKGPQLQAEQEAAWYAALPDDLKGEKSVLRHASLEDAIRAGLGAEKRLGVPHDQLVRLPSKPEEFAEVYRKLGAPDTAEGYQIGLPDNATEQDKADAKSFAEHMHKAGPFPPDVLKAAVGWNNAQATAAAEAEAAAAAERKTAGETLLKTELGAAYDPEMKAVGQLLNELGGKELADEFDATGHGDNPRLMLALHKVVERLGESQKLDGQGSGGGKPGAITPGQAKAAIENLENDPVKGAALRDNGHSMHKSVVEERSRLLRIAEGMDPDA